MKYIVALMAVIFSLNSFAYLKDFPLGEMERSLKSEINEHSEYPVDAYLFGAARSVRVNGLGAYKAEMIAKKDEYLFWKNYYLAQLTQIIDKSNMMLDKDISTEERDFLVRVILLAKYYQDRISKNRVQLAKYTQDVWQIMSNIWPGQIVAVNITKLNNINAIDDRAGLLFLLHELIHDYYKSGLTAPTTGPDVAPDEVIFSCAYQENLAWDSQVRFEKLLNKFDRPVDVVALNISQSYYAHGDPIKWKDYLDRYCARP